MNKLINFLNENELAVFKLAFGISIIALVINFGYLSN